MSAAAVRGVTASADMSLRRAFTLAWTLAVTDFKLRFYGSLLGVAWSLVRPFAFFAVIYVVFAKIAGMGAGVPNYPAYILVSLVLFQFFAELTGSSVGAVVARENLLRKMRFPYSVIPLSVVMTALMNLGMTLVAVVIFLAIIGVYPAWSWWEMGPLVVLLALFGAGIGLILSSLFVKYRDVQPIWEVVSQMLFYASPVLYVATIVPDRFRHEYMVNPIASILTQMRHTMMDPAAPSAATAIGGSERLLIPVGIVAGVVLVGTVVFRRQAPGIAENL